MNEKNMSRQPIRSLQAMLHTIFRNNPEYTSVLPDGIYGKETVAAVSRFQQLNGIPATGVTDQNTWNHIVLAYDAAMTELDAAQPLQMVMPANTPICRGDCCGSVSLAQSMLEVLSRTYGCAHPLLSGVWDEASEDSLCSFQSLCGLPISGKLDKCTWKHLALQFPLADILQKKMARTV